MAMAEAMVKGSTTGLERVIFVLGSETFFRKLVCASITQGGRRTADCHYRIWFPNVDTGLINPPHSPPFKVN